MTSTVTTNNFAISTALDSLQQPNNGTNTTTTLRMAGIEAPQEQQQQQRQPSHIIPGSNPNATALALLYPTGLVGGYRNQAMRFVAFLHQAMEHNISQILLPSLVWGTRYFSGINFFWPVGHAELFDVAHWNAFHHDKQRMDSNKTRAVSLPLLVDRLDNSDCWRFDDWTESEIDDMQQHLLGDSTATNHSMISVRNSSWFVPKLTADALLNPSSTSQSILGSTPTHNATLDYLSGRKGVVFRKLDYRDSVKHCQHPRFHGGGTMAGVLWNEFLKGNAGKNTPLIAAVQQALIPAPQWRQLANQCLGHYLGNSSNDDHQSHAYVVLHARVERDMMVHRCGKDMEKNLTKIFDMADRFIDQYNQKIDLANMIWQQQGNDTSTITTNTAAGRKRRLQGTMVAVGRDGMQDKDPAVKEMIQNNWKTLNERSILYHNATSAKRQLVSNKHQTQLPMFECGDGWVQEAFYNARPDVVDNYYGDILPSIVNFWLAVQADVFVGVMKSSWSNDVWRTRYYLGKGSHNFQYVNHGTIIPVENWGLPPAHNC